MVWPIVPRNEHHRVRSGVDRRNPDPVLSYTGPERRGGLDRRRMRRTVTPGLESGWLTFESAAEKRRLAPIPAGWEDLDDAGLEQLCQRARPVPKIKLI
jgi:hypothetical protein